MTLHRAFGYKLNRAVDQREQRVVFADTHVLTRVQFSAALTNDDTARIDALTAVDFNAQSLRLGIATVPRSAAAFLLCHVLLLFR